MMSGLSSTDPREERDGAEYLELIKFPGGLITIGLSSFVPLEERDAPEYLELVELYNRILPTASSVNVGVFSTRYWLALHPQ